MGLTDGNIESYGFDFGMERAIAAYSCKSHKFWGRVGRALDLDLIENKTVKLTLEAVRAITTDLGRGPSDSLVVIARLRRWMEDGKVTLEQILAVGELLEDADDANLPLEDEIASEVVPVLKRRAQQKAVRMAIASNSQDDDNAEQIAEQFTNVARIGETDTTQGIRIGVDSFEEIRKLRRMQRLSTGIDELDMVLGGGLAKKALGIVVGGAGDGKSMFLSHVAAQCMYDGLSIMYATTEIPEGEVLARIKANLTDIPIDAITSGEREQDCMDQLGKLAGRKFDFRPGLGLGIVKEFAPFSTTVHDIRSWFDNCEQMEGRPIDVLFVDYADRLGAGTDKGEYHAMKIVYQDLRDLIDDKGIFGWSASQATRDSKDRKRHDLSHMADSMHKGRIADLVVTLNLQGEEADEMEYYVAKHRTGRSRVSVGPMRHDWEHGMMSPVTRTL